MPIPDARYNATYYIMITPWDALFWVKHKWTKLELRIWLRIRGCFLPHYPQCHCQQERPHHCLHFWLFFLVFIYSDINYCPHSQMLTVTSQASFCHNTHNTLFLPTLSLSLKSFPDLSPGVVYETMCCDYFNDMPEYVIILTQLQHEIIWFRTTMTTSETMKRQAVTFPSIICVSIWWWW